MIQKYVVYLEYDSGVVEPFHIDLTSSEFKTLNEMYVNYQKENRLKIFRIFNLDLNHINNNE